VKLQPTKTNLNAVAAAAGDSAINQYVDTNEKTTMKE
jgi:hypothetical protein